MREVILNICLTALALCLFKMLVPETSMKKQTNFLVACFFLASLMFFFTTGRINPAHGADFGSLLSLEAVEFANFDAEYSEIVARATERELHTKLTRILAERDIHPQEIYINVNISDKYSISIKEIRLVFPGRCSVSQQGEEFQESDEFRQQIEMLRDAIHIVQKEVGGRVFVTGQFKEEVQT